MGTGDWNDGMNRVGREGRGESVWMGFFLCYTLNEFLPLCRQRRDSERVERYSRYRDGPADRARTAPGGTANGTDAPTTTTARHWARRRTTSAASMLWRRRGR